MAIPIEKYARALAEMAEKPESDLSSLAANFVGLLKRHHRINDLPMIIREIERFYANNARLTERVVLEYAGDYNPEEQLRELITALFPKKQISMIAKKNPALVGGMRVIVRGHLFDGSVAEVLTKFKKRLVH